jgi:restriction system protein
VTDYLIKKLQKYPQDIYRVTPRQFEEIIADLLKDKGFDIELTQQSRDGGKDILAYLNTDAGKLLTLVEAKRYGKTKPVGVSIIRSLYGTLCDYDANSAMLVTTSRFSKDTKEFQKKHPYRLALREYSDVVEWINKYKGK